MKRIFTILLLLVNLGLMAQSYNNEWIDYSKTYYKFKVGATGLYRIPQSVLATAGLGSVPAQNFQLFRNGQEVPVYTSVASGPLGGSDYVEFWGQINDGAPDQPLYRSPAYQHTKHWSLETDTAVYFLTVNPSGSAFHFIPTTNDVAGSTLTPEPYFLHKAATYFRSATVNPGFAQIVGEYIYSSSYDIGEFWGSSFIVPGSPLVNVQNNLFVYPGGPDASIKFGMTGCADNPRDVQLAVNNAMLGDTAMNSFFDWSSSRAVPLSLLSSGTATVQFTDNSSVSTDRTVASYYELTYPRQFNFGGQPNFLFELPARSTGFLLNITNFAISGSIVPVLYDLTNGLRYQAVVSGSTLSFALGGSGTSRRLVLVNEDPSTVNTVGGLTSKNFVNFANSANQGNYIIISNPLLYTGSSGNNPVLDYKNYRSSPAGGSYDAQIYDINELVDQFAFGIKKHPLSIQNFLRYARAVFAAKPQYVLLIGHGMTYTDYNMYSETNHDPLADVLNMVPTFGYPASDNKLSAANGVDAVGVIPIGRLSVISGAELENYLSKVKEYEQVQATSPNTIDGRLWMKNMLHLTGASEPYLGTILCNYMTAYAQIVSDTLFGAKVYIFCDGNAGQISQTPTAVIGGLFSGGFTALNYFGHSSNVALGYNLDNPNDYNNAGKYPVFYVNGCDAGDFFVYDNQRLSVTSTLSETYVLAKERGAIAFVASTHFGIVNYLNILLAKLYGLMDGADYGKSIGIMQKDALQQLVNVAPTDYFARLHAEEMTTHGDPALKLNQSPLPDYDIEASQVQISPSFISVANSSFTMKVKFYNLGKVIHDSISYTIQRQYPDGSTTLLVKKKIPAIVYADSLQLTVPIIATRDKGQNRIIVTINSDNNVTEITTANNSVTTGVYIYEDEASPVYPYDYAIINNSTQHLFASVSNPFSPSHAYVMQLDTTTAFNSSSRVSGTVTQVGGVLEFDPHFTYRDSMVYYWRVAMVPPPDSPYKWNVASFIYIDSITSKGGGYNQSHFFQQLESTSDSLYLDSASRSWKFVNVTDNIYVRGGVFPNASPQQPSYVVALNGNAYVGPGCNYDELIINVIDPVTFMPWANDFSSGTGLYGSYNSNCGTQREFGFDYFITSAATRKQCMDFLNNIIPPGYIVVIRNNANPVSAGNTYPSAWRADTALYGSHNSLYDVLLNAGFLGIDSIYQPRGFGFVYRKNTPSFTPRYQVTLGLSDQIAMSVDYVATALSGVITSPTFGPARKWRQLHWRGASLESPSTDNVSLNLYGIDTTGNSSLLFGNLTTASQDVDISSIDAKKYPNVQLKLSVQDPVKGTPYQLQYWRVTDDPAPEGALAPNIYMSLKDTVALGEPLNFSIAFKNVSPTAFDSMVIKLNIIDAKNVTHVITLPKRKPLVSGDTLTVSFSLDTKTYPGLNTIYLFVNPDNNQPEQYLFNNFLYKTFFVTNDSRNPTMDVTFDNVHILNDDIVSARPHIQVKLKSQSDYLLLTDTSLITLQVRYPDGTLRGFNFNNDTVRFTPASTSNSNTATVDFNPAFLTQYNASGDDYQLIVTGKDANGNTAGSIPYRVTFRIISKPMISNLLNYPNPFTTSTAFVFTITGTDVPQNMKIEILTITGKIVREITKEELGPLHVGRNITEFKWDGKDMYGQRLANGVYLYHVVTNLNGHSLDKYKAAGDNTDKYFNNGYGKMYLMK